MCTHSSAPNSEEVIRGGVTVEHAVLPGDMLAHELQVTVFVSTKLELQTTETKVIYSYTSYKLSHLYRTLSQTCLSLQTSCHLYKLTLILWFIIEEIIDINYLTDTNKNIFLTFIINNITFYLDTNLKLE